jgi:hypothetical protein
MKQEDKRTPKYKNSKDYDVKPIIDWDDDCNNEYITRRLGPFTLFLDNERVKVRKKEVDLQRLLIIAGALIPIVNVTGIPTPFSNILSASLGGIVVVIASILQLQKYHERWLSFKMVTTKLSNEYYYWRNDVEDYSNLDNVHLKLSLLVKRCEKIILSEASDYVGLFTSQNDDKKNP